MGALAKLMGVTAAGTTASGLVKLLHDSETIYSAVTSKFYGLNDIVPYTENAIDNAADFGFYCGMAALLGMGVYGVVRYANKAVGAAAGIATTAIATAGVLAYQPAVDAIAETGIVSPVAMHQLENSLNGGGGAIAALTCSALILYGIGSSIFGRKKNDKLLSEKTKDSQNFFSTKSK